MSSDDWRDLYEERAAILEYEAGITRQTAERMARREVARLRQERNTT